jgi:hypothetical protein
MDYLKELYEIEKEYYINLPNVVREYQYKNIRYNSYIFEFIFNNIERVCDFEKCEGDEGVYLIEDFYIGKSNRIRKRIAEHLQECLYDPSKFTDEKFYKFYIKSNNLEKVNRIRKILSDGKLKIKLLSDDTSKEALMIMNGHSMYNLTNRTNKPK